MNSYVYYLPEINEIREYDEKLQGRFVGAIVPKVTMLNWDDYYAPTYEFVYLGEL